MSDVGKWMSVGEAAQMLEVSRQRVHQLIRNGGLVSYRVGNQLIVSIRSVEARIALLKYESELNGLGEVRKDSGK